MKISGGDKFEAALKEIAKKISKPATLEVGFMGDADYPNGTPVALVAAIQEFGAPSRNIPPRPFFRNMVAEKSPEWPDAIAESLKANGYDASKTLAQLGLVIAGELQESITEFTDPKLSDVTIMLRGMRKQKRYRDMPFGALIKEAISRVEKGKTNYGASTKPLIDTGRLLNAVTYNVTDENMEE